MVKVVRREPTEIRENKEPHLDLILAPQPPREDKNSINKSMLGAKDFLFWDNFLLVWLDTKRTWNKNNNIKFFTRFY